MISYWINAPEAKAPQEGSEIDDKDSTMAAVKWDSVILKIYDEDRLIRTIKRAAPEEPDYTAPTEPLRKRP